MKRTQWKERRSKQRRRWRRMRSRMRTETVKPAALIHNPCEVLTQALWAGGGGGEGGDEAVPSNTHQ